MSNHILAMEKRLDNRFDAMDKRVDGLEQRFDNVDLKLSEIEGKADGVIGVVSNWKREPPEQSP